MKDVKNLTVVQRERRERILSSTREQLSKLGYEGLNMRDLAVDAEVSTSTLYNLYQSKDALILVALEDLLSGLNEQVIARGVTGLDRVSLRAQVIAQQIVDTPQYAEAMGRMLFGAEPSDPIVTALIGGTMENHSGALDEMIEAGELKADVDRAFLQRSLASVGWSTILMWMKGYVALQDFKREYHRSVLLALLPWVTPETEQRIRDMV